MTCTIDRLASYEALRRHRHAWPYAAIVISGDYEEAGDSGQWRARAGQVLFHHAYEAHCNLIGGRGATVINLPLPLSISLPAAFEVDDFDRLVQAALRDPIHALELLVPAGLITPLVEGWADQLAARLRAAPGTSISGWAKANGLAPATVSRGFARRFGETPARYRAAAQARRAWSALTIGSEPLAAIAADCGFADQAHMTRAVVRLTSLPPSSWRKVKSVQDRSGRLGP